MHKEVFTQLLTDFAQPLSSEIACDQDWLHAAFRHQQLPLSGTVFSFYQLRANSWIYAGEKKLDATDIKMEQAHIRLFLSLHWELLGLKPLDWHQAEGELEKILDFLKNPELAERVATFFISNLIENFNLLVSLASPDEPQRVKFYVQALEKLLNYSLFFHKKHYFSYFEFNKHYVNFFSAACKKDQDNFLNTFLATSWFSITSHPGTIGSWLHSLLKSGHREKVLQSYFFAVNQESDLVFQSLQFFTEENLKIVVSPTSSRRELEVMLKIYSRFKDPFFLEPWTVQDYEGVIALLKKEKQLPHYSLNGFINLLTKYYDFLEDGRLSEEEKNKIKLIREILKLHFDEYLAPELSSWEKGLLEEFPPQDYFLLDWTSSKAGPVPEFVFFHKDLSASKNIEELFGIKSFRFKKQLLSYLYDLKFKRVNSEILAFSLLKDIFTDKNYLISLVEHFSRNIPQLVVAYSRFVRTFSTYDNPRGEVEKAKTFLLSHYSQEKIYHLFLKNGDFFSLIQNLIDCARGFESLKQAISREHAPRMLNLPSRIKSLEELHTIIYQRVALLQTEKVKLYAPEHEAFILDGFSFFNGWSISVPKTSWDLKIYGINMHNCVGGYVDKIIRGESIILNILWKKKSWINVEIKDRKVWEMKKIKNENLSEQEAKEIILVLTHSGLIN